MIDLSFLTEEEQEAILAVLRRDAELKKAEEQRVQNLQKTVSDKGQLRYMTGEWFYETKQLRHQDRIHGSEIIRASMRHSHKPLTTLELSQIWPEKPSYVSSENKDVFAPPVLCGVLQEPEYQNQKPYETPQDTPNPVLQSPTKQRKNPFNSDVITNHPFEEKDSQLLDGAVDQVTDTQTLNEEPLPSSDSCISYASNIKQDHNDSPNASVPMSMPENREVITRSQPCFVEEDGQGDQQTNTAAPRGILKRLSTSSSTDSLFSRLDLQSPVSLDSLPETWIDRKQVRFSSTVGWSELEWQDGKELGEHSLLDVDSVTPSELENNSDLDHTGSTTVGTRRPLLRQSQVDSQEGELNCKDEASLQEQEAGQHPVLGDVSEHCHSEVLSHAVPKLVSAEQESGKPVHLETEPEEEQHSQAEATDWPTGHNIHPQKLPEQRTDISVEVTSDTKPFNGRPKGSSHAVSPKPRHIFEKERTAEVQSPQKEESSDRSQLRSLGSTGDVQSTCHQSQVKANTEHQERPLSPSKSQSPKSKDQDDEVRRSPSKTFHPRVLPRESSSPKISKLEGSPLKTFSIDIDPQTKVVEEQEVKATPVPRQKKSPSHEAKQTVQTDAIPTTDITSRPLPLLPEDRAAYFGNVNTQQSSSSSFTSTQSKKASEKKLGTFARLARSLIPQDYQHYLGPQEKAHVPPFHQDRAVAAEKEVEHTPQNALRDFVGNQRDSSTVGNPPAVTSSIVQNKDGYSSQNTSTRAGSLSRASSGSHDDSSSPIISALKQLSSRNISSSKSLENLTSQTREERTQNNSREQMNQSVDNVSLLPPSASTLPNSKQMKSSVSVTVLQQDETDSDSTSETILGWRRNTGSSTSNLSLSSGMASMSSVSGSMSSIHPADFGDVEVQGSIQFAVNYIQKLGEFHIFVVHCRDLAMAETKKNCTDPYVKCYLLPDKTKLGKRKTTVKKKTLNPTYNEILRFKIIMEVLKTQNLNISVWHNNTFGWNSFLGEVDLDLSEWDFSNTHINEFPLKARVSAQSPAPSPLLVMDSRGQMRVALRFLPQTSHSKRTARIETGEVQIWVKDCKNLPPVRGVIIDPFVKCTVLPDTSQRSRQKTRVVKRTANPMFNHTMVYDGFRPEDLREACVEITVWDHDRLNNHHIGGLRLGLGTGKSYGLDVVWMDSTTDEANLWERMLQSDGEWVEDVLPLRMLVMAKSMSK
ncbi:hypothetical protein PFLUV_G00196610 [Perca fluviatilis]|uniref:Synaptotagmin-like protein 2 n=1 Tax=Perca fluviatilis TaxID=8168 RepID=A0A6A5EJ95_PERFL|nr:hypothetical protein PFLUV_G00196610 [Perca fluviatilis]